MYTSNASCLLDQAITVQQEARALLRWLAQMGMLHVKNALYVHTFEFYCVFTHFFCFDFATSCSHNVSFTCPNGSGQPISISSTAAAPGLEPFNSVSLTTLVIVV